MVPSNYRRLIETLQRPNCDLEAVRSVLKEHPITQSNVGVLVESPLVTAIRKDLGTEILKELLQHGFNVNHWSLDTTPLREAMMTRMKIQNRVSYVEFLLNNGGSVNTPQFDPDKVQRGVLVRDFLDEVSHTDRSERFYFLPILKLVLAHLDEKTKNYALSVLFRNTLEHIVCRWEVSTRQDPELMSKTRSIQSGIEAVNMLIQSGARPSLDMLRIFFRKVPVGEIEPFSGVDLSSVKQLCKLSIECMILTDCRRRRDAMKIFERSVQFEPRGGYSLNEKSKDCQKRLYSFIRDLWRRQLVQRKKMENKMLKSNISLWDSVTWLCGINSGLKNDILLEIFRELSRNKDPLLRSAVLHTAKNLDLMKFYEYIWSSGQICENAFRLNPDCFRLVSEYLTKEDIFNHLLAIIL